MFELLVVFAMDDLLSFSLTGHGVVGASQEKVVDSRGLARNTLSSRCLGRVSTNEHATSYLQIRTSSHTRTTPTEEKCAWEFSFPFVGDHDALPQPTQKVLQDDKHPHKEIEQASPRAVCQIGTEPLHAWSGWPCSLHGVSLHHG